LFFLAGACVVDVTLSCAFTATLVGFAFADRSRGWSWLMSAGLAAGVLVKGPLILVLTGLTVVPWTLLRYWSTGHWPKQISAIRWIDGTAIFLGLVVPWFWLKEQQYPGSLRYFIWNENIARFLFKEYGDIYGKGHVQPFGVVWLMLVLGLFPWSFCAIWSLWQSRTRFKLTALREWCAQNPWGLYGFLWMTSTAVLFTAARQYTGTYLVPSIPGAAILAATLLSPPRSADSSAAPTSEYQSGSYVNVCRLLSIVWVLTLIIGASVLFLRYNAGAFMTLVAVAVGLSLLVRDTRRHLWTDAQRATQQLALTTILLFSCAIGLLAPHISANRSTRDVLAFAQDWGTTRHKAQVRVGFAYNYPFSAGFYGTPPGSETPQATILTVPVSTDQLTSTDVDLLVVRNRNVSQLTGLPANWRRIETQGAWEVFARDGVG
jgi:4-amino-4-deoxy-L-arabinose transferase-like glycosyltransferase